MSDLFIRLHIWGTTLLHDVSLDWNPNHPTSPASPMDALDGTGPQPPAVRDRGQATTEYALVLLGAASIALLIITWATSGGGAGRIGRLFDRVIDAVTSKL